MVDDTSRLAQECLARSTCIVGEARGQLRRSASSPDVICRFSDGRCTLEVSLLPHTPSAATGLLLERWSFALETASGPSLFSADGRACEPPTQYKRLIILLRSIQATLRLLPAHRLVGAPRFSLHVSHLSTPPPPLVDEDFDWQRFTFAAVQTSLGGSRATASVTWRPASAVAHLLDALARPAETPGLPALSVPVPIPSRASEHLDAADAAMGGSPASFGRRTFASSLPLASPARLGASALSRVSMLPSTSSSGASLGSLFAQRGVSPPCHSSGLGTNASPGSLTPRLAGASLLEDSAPLTGPFVLDDDTIGLRADAAVGHVLHLLALPLEEPGEQATLDGATHAVCAFSWADARRPQRLLGLSVRRWMSS